MHFESDSWIFGLRTLLLLAAFAGFAWALVSARRQSEQASAQVAARLETALVEIRRLSGQVLALGGSSRRRPSPRRRHPVRLRLRPADTPAAMKRRSAWRAVDPRSKRSSRTAAPRAPKPNY